ncbi:MAG: methyl-accepting chemotaxis protein [Gammaproteobacteria bacterium]|nr:methyl-accepting chemotaxis protein [Gammaproteobacteria bacterium]
MKSKAFQLSVIQIQQWLTDISATRGLDGLDDGLDEAEKHFNNARTLVVEMGQLDPAREEQYRMLDVAVNDFYKTGRHMASLYIEHGPNGGNPYMDTFDKTAAHLYEKMNILMKGIQDSKEKSLIHFESTIANSQWILEALVFIFGSLIVVGILYLMRSIRLLDVIRKHADDLANNDLTSEVHMQSRSDEIGALASSFAIMQQHFKQSLQKINQASSAVATLSTQMSEVSSETLSNAKQERAQSANIATAIEQMTATTHEIARNISAAVDAADSAQDAVVKGEQVVSNTIHRINQMAEGVQNGNQSVRKLVADSESIGTVLDVIRDIAEQTNLLALNAAIEAARAGEQGRGFAVVADEVRTLATRTQQSTEEIQSMIERLQLGASNASQVMEEGQRIAEDTVQQASETSNALREIRDSVNHIKDMATLIATASEEQSAASDEINRNIHIIESDIEKTAFLMEDTAEASNTLMHESENLRGIVAEFRI